MRDRLKSTFIYSTLKASLWGNSMANLMNRLMNGLTVFLPIESENVVETSPLIDTGFCLMDQSILYGLKV